MPKMSKIYKHLIQQIYTKSREVSNWNIRKKKI